MADRVRRVIAFDPGPTTCGYAIAEHGRDAGNRVRFLAGGEVSSDAAMLGQTLGCGAGVDAVCVETPAGYVYEKFRGPTLIETARVAERIAILAGVRGTRVVQMSAAQWRKALCSKANADDKRIKRAVQMVTTDLPSRTNEHLRDALGLAIVVLWNPRLLEAA